MHDTAAARVREVACPPAREEAPAPAARGELPFALAVTLAYVAVAGAAALVHEPWRDETQAWLVARDAASLGGLLHNLRYEGHPGLWHLLLWPLTRLGGPALMKPLAVALGAGAAFVVARFAPFPRAARALFALGYLLVWEWGAVERNYGLGALLLVGAAALAARRERYPLLLGAALGLAANAAAFAAVVAGGLVALLVVERLAPWRDPARAAPAPRFWAGVALAVAGLAACALQIRPPPDSGVAGMWGARTVADRLGKTVAAPVHGLAQLPWGGALDRHPALAAAHLALGVAVAVALAAAAVAALRRRRGAWIAAALPWATLLLLFYFKYYGGVRHAGFLLLALLLALWVAPTFPLRPGAAEPAGGDRRLGAALTAAFGVAALGTAIQFATDGPGVYSAAQPTAALVREAGLAGLPVVGDPDHSASAVVAFLGAPAAYYANVERWGSFAVFDLRHDPSWPERAPDAAVFARARELARDTGALVVLDRAAAPEAAAGARLVGARRADVRADESFWVYLVPPRPAAAP